MEAARDADIARRVSAAETAVRAEIVTHAETTRVIASLVAGMDKLIAVNTRLARKIDAMSARIRALEGVAAPRGDDPLGPVVRRPPLQPLPRDTRERFEMGNNVSLLPRHSGEF